MKKILMMTAAAMMAAANLTAQTAADTVYVFEADQPDVLYFLPAPPDSTSLDFVDDMLQWEWSKTQRLTPRGEKASRESMWQAEAMRKVMGEALGIDSITDEAMPAMSRLLVKAYNTGNANAGLAKGQGWRTRPFLMMNEHCWAQYDDEPLLAKNSSYPSGHTAFAWATALAFAEMWPALQDTILRRGFEFGENRVITGAQWQSDVYAGYHSAAAAIARAHTNPELHNDIMAARAEYAKLKGLPEDYDPVEGTDVPHGEMILNNPVDTASYRYISDVTRYWAAKPIRYTPRGKQAAHEAEYSVEMMYEVFGEAMQMTLSPQMTPAICNLIDLILDKASETADRLKPLRFRKRPFVQLNEPSFVAGDEEKERGKSSFPSGHTNLGWTTALMMAEVAPDCQDEILRRGYQYGYNRLIVGYHWATDIEATRMLSSALVARLHAAPEVQQLIALACEEYKQVTSGIDQTPVAAPSAGTTGAADNGAATYDLQGRRLEKAPSVPGIYITNGQKTVVK